MFTSTFGRQWGCFVLVALSGLGVLMATSAAPAYEQIHVGFLWHMHQPIYYPYESPGETDANNRFSFSVVDVHNQRSGPYTSWPRDAVQAGLHLWYLGAQVSFTGSLIENLNSMGWGNWSWAYDEAVSWTTVLGNPRLDMVAFGYHHPLMALLDEQDLRMQIKLHKHICSQTWNGGPAYSKGMFPPETAFSTRMIPALVAEGIEWVLVDNIHFDRACVGYPYTTASNLFAPNPADQLNPNPTASGGAWVQLNDIWAPSQVSAPFGYQPHYAQYVDPDTGTITKMIVVPAARYEGNEDARGGYGAFLYDQVMDQYIAYNTDAAHPMFVMLHHDGDNYGGGTDSYYHSNFQNMVNWVSNDPDYDVSTVQDYLDRFPPGLDDVIHVEDGAWSGADNGDPEFKKWLGDPDGGGWSPDRNSWAVLTAAKNRVFTAEAVAPAVSMQNVLTGGGTNTENAWRWLLVSQASDYWYWDGTEIWDSNVTRGCNQAVAHADAVIAGQPDTVPPTIFLPQREPYNPGGYEWGASPEPSDFEVWTYAYDVSGLTGVTLKWRVDGDGVNSLSSVQNETYAGGPEVGAWNSTAMTWSDVPPQNGVLTPAYRALCYSAMITGQENVLIDYYVEAVDGNSLTARSDIQHVYVGVGGSGQGGATIDPDPAVAGQNVTIHYDPAGGPLAGASDVYLHYGFNGWGSTISPDPAMTWNTGDAVWEITVMVQSSATQLDMVFHDGADTWDNNGGADWHFNVTGGADPVTIDPNPAEAGQNVLISYDPSSRPLAGVSEVYLHYGFDGWAPTISPDPAMSWNEGEAVWQISVMVQSSATQLDMVFNDGADTWDNNGGADWHFDVVGGTPAEDPWEMDGALDANATEIASNNGMVLYAGYEGGLLYVATWDAGEGNDHFIFLAGVPGALQAAPWDKAGQVAGWGAFIGNENDSLWAGWFDNTATVQVATSDGSGYLEGTINLVEEFGTLPVEVHLAVAPYPTADGAGLLHEYQVPASINSDGNVDAGEYALVNICDITVTHEPADFDEDCDVDLADFEIFSQCLNGPELPAAGTCPSGVDADLDGDGDVDLSDFAVFQTGFVG